MNTKKKTFVDSSVLLTAIRGNEQDAEAAFEILGDPDREFASSIFVKLELLPKAAYYHNEEEREFYQTFFESVTYWADFSGKLLQEALEEAQKCGMGALDALHIVAAASIGVEELVTTEKPSKSIHRSRIVKVVSIHD